MLCLMWDSWCGFPHPCSDDPASSPSFLKPISHAWAASQPTCLRKTELLLPTTPWALRTITHCRETSAITVWKADACQISHAANFPCCIPSRHRSCCRCHALVLLGTPRHQDLVGAMAWPRAGDAGDAGDAPLTCHPPTASCHTTRKLAPGK